MVSQIWPHYEQKEQKISPLITNCCEDTCTLAGKMFGAQCVCRDTDIQDIRVFMKKQVTVFIINNKSSKIYTYLYISIKVKLLILNECMCLSLIYVFIL